MLRRRRPLMRAAALGGTAYAAGRHQGRKAGQQDEQDYSEPPPAQAAPAPAPAGETDRIATLGQLKQLLDSGVLTQEEFDREKQKVLQGP